jgi:hypothetical protein
MEKRKAKTIRLEPQDWEAIAAIKETYAISSDNDAIRFALRMAYRELQRQALPSPAPNKERQSHPLL